MKISDIDLIQVAVPLEAPIRWAFGVRSHATRNIVRLRLNDGTEGIGETVGGETVHTILRGASRMIVGESPFALERISAKLRMQPYFAGYAGCAAVNGLEMACWDAMGKVTGRPVYDLMGGLLDGEIEFSGYLYFRYRSADGQRGGEEEPADIVRQAEAMVERHSFRVLKLKGGVLPPEIEVATLAALRQRFGAAMRLRIDPQANWTYTTALAWGPRLKEIGLEYLEDPIWGLEAMARLRKDLSIPFATNMCVVDPDTLQVAVRLMPVDIVLADPHRWGGLLATKKLAAVAETLGMALSVHSAAELGVSTAACLHLAASTPGMRFALDTHAPHQLDDITTQPFVFRQGRLKVPDRPGLGVQLDEAKLQRYAETYREQATTSIPAHMKDPFRPDFVPRPY